MNPISSASSAVVQSLNDDGIVRQRDRSCAILNYEGAQAAYYWRFESNPIRFARRQTATISVELIFLPMGQKGKCSQDALAQVGEGRRTSRSR